MIVFFLLQQERQKRIGPGGLDPVEVFESLPKVLFFSYKQLSFRKYPT